MKKIIYSFVTLSLITCACGTTTQNTVADSASEAEPQAAQTAPDTTPDIEGQWKIEQVAIGDSINLRPAEEKNGNAGITFENGRYSITTNCNSIQGEYTLNGNSIVLHAGLTTEMACDNMQLEDGLKKILPAISTIESQNDSTIRFSSKNSDYIMLSRP